MLQGQKITACCRIEGLLHAAGLKDYCMLQTGGFTACSWREMAFLLEPLRERPAEAYADCPR